MIARILAILLALMVPAAAQSLLPGSVQTGRLDLGNKYVALPPGDWIVASDRATDWKDPSLGAFGYIRQILLLHSAANAVDAVLEVNTNLLPTTDGWGVAGDCSRPDLLLAVIHYRAGWDGACYFVTHTQLDRRASPGWTAVGTLAAARGWTLPRVALTAGFRAASRSDVVDLRFHFAPPEALASAPAGAWNASPWAPGRIESDAARTSFARSVAQWALAYTAIADAGLKNLPPSVETTPPALPQPAGNDIDAVTRARSDLLLLHQAGKISDAEFASRLRLISPQEADRQGAAGSGNTADIAAITFTKALSYRMIVSVSHIFVDYYWTGNYVAAGALEILQITINSTKFYFHELAWAKYIGSPRTDAARVVDFAYIGTDS